MLPQSIHYLSALAQSIHYLSTLVMGILLLWGAWKNHLKCPLTIVALLMIVQPLMPVVLYRSNILSIEPAFLSITLVTVYALLWGAWTSNLGTGLGAHSSYPMALGRWCIRTGIVWRLPPARSDGLWRGAGRDDHLSCEQKLAVVRVWVVDNDAHCSGGGCYCLRPPVVSTEYMTVLGNGPLVSRLHAHEVLPPPHELVR